MTLDQLEQRVIATFGVPRAILGVPQPDQWTTPYADLLQSCGYPEEAAVERSRACREARIRMGLDPIDSRRWMLL